MSSKNDPEDMLSKIDLLEIEEYIHSFPGRDEKNLMTGSDADVYLASFLLREIAERAGQVLSGTDILEAVQNMYAAAGKLKAVVVCRPRVFGEEASEQIIQFIDELWLLLTEMRDYEILMASLAGYCEELPEIFTEGRKGIREILRKRATVRRSALTKYLRSEGFTTHVNAIKTFIVDHAEGSGDDAFSAEDTANAKISNAFYVLDVFISEKDTSDIGIKTFRILCKKLGYMIELYGQFSDIKKLGKTAEKLQSIREMMSMNNNLSAQIKILESLAPKLTGNELGALASLLTIIGAVKSEVTDEITETIKVWSKKDKFLDIKKKKIMAYVLEDSGADEVSF